jgi:hypothetical protein
MPIVLYVYEIGVSRTKGGTQIGLSSESVTEENIWKSGMT